MHESQQPQKLGSLDKIHTRAPSYSHFPESSPNRHRTTITFADEGVHSHSTIDTSSHPHGDRQTIHDPCTKTHKPKKRRVTKRPLPPLQRSGTHTTLLSQKSPQTTCSCGKCTDCSSGLGPRSKMTLIPYNQPRRSPSLPKEDNS